jgi:hypothetical protein
MASIEVVIRPLKSNLDFGVTVKKEVVKIVDTSRDIDVVKPHATRKFQK